MRPRDKIPKVVSSSKTKSKTQAKSTTKSKTQLKRNLTSKTVRGGAKPTPHWQCKHASGQKRDAGISPRYQGAKPVSSTNAFAV